MLEGRHLSVAFDGRPVLDDVSLAVAPGERVQLAAPSGTGKTTLCRVLAGYLAPRTGEVLVDGSPLPKRGPCPVQLIGQHPELTLDPRMRMAASLAECGASEEELAVCRSFWASATHGFRAIRMSCPAASCSASASPGPSARTRATSSPTRSPLCWTP